MASIEELWPDIKGDALLGIGYATPYLEAYREKTSPIIVCMPARQGAACWPSTEGNMAFLSHESELPLPANSINRILLLHCFEHSEPLSNMVEEMWRVLTPGGRMLAIVPNRLGLWTRSSRSPFGSGRPFSLMQLRELVSEKQFTHTRSSSALFLPPTHIRILWRMARIFEKVGKLLCPFFGGVLVIEAEKQLYASIRQPVAVRAKYPVPITANQPVLGLKSRILPIFKYLSL
jgi:SAM-dependent methyltransferase